MKTLSATLLAAQKKADRLPCVEAKVYDYEAGVKRLYWTRIYEGSEPDNHHGMAFDGQGSMHRIRAAAGNLLYYQKVAGPGPASDFSQWTQMAADCAGPCAVAACGTRVYIFYRTTGNVLRKYYSHDHGQTWNGAQLADYAGVLSLAACWWGTGDIVVCFALKSGELNGITLDTVTQSAVQHAWSDGNHPLIETCGIGATFNASTPAMEIVFAGKESGSPYNHYDLFRTRFSNTYNFLALESFLMSPEGEDIAYEYPDCHLPADPQACETTRIVAVEKFTGTTAYMRPLTCHVVKGTAWSDTTFTEPRPHPVIASGAWQSQYGLRLQSTSDYWWLERPDGIWCAARPAEPPLDISRDIISLQQDTFASPSAEGPGNLVIELDNSRGRYAQPVLFNELGKRSEIILKLGYRTTAGDEVIESGTFWVDGWQYSTAQQTQPTLTLFCVDAWGLADCWTARYQMRWNKDGINPKSVWQILYQVLARAGIRLTNSPPKPQSPAVNNLYPDFAINTGTSGSGAIHKLLSFVPDRLVFQGQEAFTKDPRADEESCYTYDVIASGEWQSHPILKGEYREETCTSRARAVGRDASGNRILEEVRDWDLLQLGIDILEQVYDPNLATAARAQERADAILRQMSLGAQRGNIVVPTNVGQELLDVIEVTDARCGIAGRNFRVQAVRTDYDRRLGRYEQRLSLGAP
jgi:hypothetical protein